MFNFLYREKLHLSTSLVLLLSVNGKVGCHLVGWVLQVDKGGKDWERIAGEAARTVPGRENGGERGKT